MQQTETYKLNLIEGSDTFSPQPLNENAEKTETILTELANSISQAGNCKSATGSYVGTGSYGINNPNVIQFNFEPQMVIVYTVPYYGPHACTAYTGGAFSTTHQVFLSGGNRFYVYDGGESSTYFTLNGGTLSWYTTGEKANHQMNGSGTTYHYIAIG